MAHLADTEMASSITFLAEACLAILDEILGKVDFIEFIFNELMESKHQAVVEEYYEDAQSISILWQWGRFQQRFV
jgi:hypothetical protein